MPRQARKKSSAGIYHIMLRGVNQQQIFEEQEDCDKFLQVLKDCKAISEFKLFAYCLMGNHIHILLQETDEPIELLMKRIATRFVYWYNIKYKRSGHLFQDRFKSEPVEDDAYFLTVLRYIHQNPLKAGLCKNVNGYEYSSYNEYLHSPKIISKEMIIQHMTLQEFVKYNNLPNSDTFLEMEEASVPKQTEEQAKELIKSKTGCDTIARFQSLPKQLRQEYLQQLRAE